MPKQPTYKFWRFSVVKAARVHASIMQTDPERVYAEYLRMFKHDAGHPADTAKLEGSYDGQKWNHVGMLRINVFVDFGAKE